MTEPSVSATVSDVVAACESLWPRNGAEEWDNTGLQVGRSSWRVSKVLLVVDVVADTVAEAIAGGFDAIISHHPLILRGIETISEETYKGRLIGELIRSDIALLSMHTNADVVPDGVSDVIAQALGLTSVAPILATANESTGIGRHGLLRNDISLGELAQKLASILPATAPGIQVSGDFSAPMRRVSLCGGAGDSMLETDAVRTSDVYITSDLRHHRASEAREHAWNSSGPALINVSHWASEWLWLTPASQQLSNALANVYFMVSDIRTDPWDFVVTQ
jgi:dinuclear metal center YbgI/SA1388 family protein